MHRIERLEVELTAEEATLAQSLSERTRLLQEARIAPLLDRVLGEAGGGEALHDLDRIEVDLGRIAVERFEDDLVARLEPALRAALSAPLQRAASSLELVETFARTGNLPWWADVEEPRIVSRHLALAASEAPAELV